MKKTLFLFAMAGLFTFAACESDKSRSEKAADEIEDAGDEVEDTVD